MRLINIGTGIIKENALVPYVLCCHDGQKKLNVYVMPWVHAVHNSVASVVHVQLPTNRLLLG